MTVRYRRRRESGIGGDGKAGSAKAPQNASALRAVVRRSSRLFPARPRRQRGQQLRTLTWSSARYTRSARRQEGARRLLSSPRLQLLVIQRLPRLVPARGGGSSLDEERTSVQFLSGVLVRKLATAAGTVTSSVTFSSGFALRNDSQCSGAAPFSAVDILAGQHKYRQGFKIAATHHALHTTCSRALDLHSYFSIIFRGGFREERIPRPPPPPPRRPAPADHVGVSYVRFRKWCSRSVSRRLSQLCTHIRSHISMYHERRSVSGGLFCPMEADAAGKPQNSMLSYLGTLLHT